MPISVLPSMKSTVATPLASVTFVVIGIVLVLPLSTWLIRGAVILNVGGVATTVIEYGDGGGLHGAVIHREGEFVRTGEPGIGV